MVGIKKSKLILGIIIYFLSFFIMSQNTFAASVTSITRGTIARSVNGSSVAPIDFASGLTNLPVPMASITSAVNSYYTQYIEAYGNLPSPQSGKYMDIILTGAIGYNYGAFSVLNCNGLSGWVVPDSQGWTKLADSISCEISDNSTVFNFQITTAVELASASTNVTNFKFHLLNPLNYIFSCSNNAGSFAYPCRADTSLRLTYLDIKVNVYNDPNTSLLQQQINQNQTLINQNQTIINQNDYMAQNDEEYYDRQYQANDNIANQKADDIQGSSDQKTDSLIGIITGFLNAFSNINATNCNLTLTFPEYAGGARVVNICSGKDKAPRIVEIGSSLLLILVFVPLAFIMLRLIYNEIRSWTNG